MKDKLIKVCNIVAFIFTLSFVLKLARDVIIYFTTLNSAPLWVWILADAVQYLMPAAFIFLVGRLVKYKKDKEETDTDHVR